MIDYEAVAPVAAKGKAEPLLAWRALQPRSRLGVDVRQHGAAPLAPGHGASWTSSFRPWSASSPARDAARDARRRPGIGKSRLVWETLQAVEADPEIIFWRQGAPTETG